MKYTAAITSIRVKNKKIHLPNLNPEIIAITTRKVNSPSMMDSFGIVSPYSPRAYGYLVNFRISAERPVSILSRNEKGYYQVA
jgi:hypothetical protein